MTHLIGRDAIRVARTLKLDLFKHADPTEPARGVTIEEAVEIVRSDPSLIWADLSNLVGKRVAGGEGQDRDAGRVVELLPAPVTHVAVAWDSGVRTPVAIEDLEVE